MNTRLDTVLQSIAEIYHDNISEDSPHYLEVNIGNAAERNGFPDIAEKFRNAFAVVPLREPVPGMKVRIDGRTFVNYEQFDSGVAVPGYVARETGQTRRSYVPNDSMILNCA